MTEQSDRNPETAIDIGDDDINSQPTVIGDVDIEVPAADFDDVETADPPRQQSDETYETPDELGGTGGPDAGGAG